MKKIIYYVAVSLDGYICGPSNDVSKFSFQSKLVDQYQKDLLSFKTTIMGRNTYEFGYDFGLPPGMPAYPNMEHFIFSNNLSFEEQSPQVHVEPLDITRVDAIKEASSTDVYLCGGGELAGWLLDHGRIDQLKLKVNPIILGGGVRLFGPSESSPRCELIEKKDYENGLKLETYDLFY